MLKTNHKNIWPFYSVLANFTGILEEYGRFPRFPLCMDHHLKCMVETLGHVKKIDIQEIVIYCW